LRRIPLLLFCAALLTPARAGAQIYAWRDASGTLVLSDRKIDAPTDVYVVEGAPAYRTTRPEATAPQENRVEADRFDSLVVEHATRHSLRPELVRAVIQVESGFNPRARSVKGAMGLMQLMPATAMALGVRDPYDPADNIRGGTAYLRQLLDRYDGNEELALAAYNAGAGAVDRHGGRVPPYRETVDYVHKVGSAAGRSGPTRLANSKRIVYKTIELVDGRLVPRYTTERPAAGTEFETLGP
jgi:soluble lytic murein transglycosylase-like protein